MLKLNLGCGAHRVPETPGQPYNWVNVDKIDTGFQDLIFDFEPKEGLLDKSQTYVETPATHRIWPWDDNSVDEVLFNHSLEHAGQDPAVFLGIMKQLYRVCCNGASIFINAPHHRHDEFFGDPTHVRPILPDTFVLMSKEANKIFREKNGANSCFAFLMDVDFQLVANQLVLDDRFEYLKDDPSWQRMAAINNNVIREIRLHLKVIKPDVPA